MLPFDDVIIGTVQANFTSIVLKFALLAQLSAEIANGRYPFSDIGSDWLAQPNQNPYMKIIFH